MIFKYNNWRRAFSKRSPLNRLKDYVFTTDHNLQPTDLEDTIDRASQLLDPYRGKIAKIEIAKNLTATAMLLLFCMIAIIVGWTTGKWLWCLFIVVIYIVLLFTCVFLLKFLYSKPLR